MNENTLGFGIASQMLAGIHTLKDCIDRCPNNEWNEKHNDYPFSQVVFHTLFDCDLSLSDNVNELKDQEFHKQKIDVFSGYEELEDKERNHVYEREFINRYFEHCKNKIEMVIGSKSNEELLLLNSDFYRSMTKSERYINAIRHIQHHAAQLGLRIQFLNGQEMNWISKWNGK